MENDTAQLFTFKLNDGRKVTYEALTERHAFNRARAYHGSAVTQEYGVRTHQCECANKWAQGTREAGWMICVRCAGRIG